MLYPYDFYWIKSKNDFKLLKMSALRFYLESKGFSCLAGRNLRKAQLLDNSIYIYSKYGV